MLVGLAIFTPEQIVVLRQGFDLGVPDDETLGSGELGFTRHTINVLSDKLRDAYTDHPQLALDLTPDEAFALEGCFTVGAEMAEQVPTEKYHEVLAVLHAAKV